MERRVITGNHKSLFFLITFLAIFIFSSCRTNTSNFVNLYDKIQISYSTENSEVKDLEENPSGYLFVPLDSDGRNNITKLIGSDGTYVWLKIDFEIPEKFKDRDLALFETSLLKADKLYINGQYVGGYGNFPPKVVGSGIAPHFYPFLKNELNQEGINTILVKGWCQGSSEVGREMFLGEYNEIENFYNYNVFYKVKIYFIFAGGLLLLVILYVLLYLGQRKNKEFIFFALLNLCTALFSFILFSSELPFYQGNRISYLWFYKIFGCICFYWLGYVFTSFIGYYLKENLTISFIWLRIFVVLGQCIVTLITPDLNTLYKICPAMLFITLGSMGPAFVMFGKNLMSKDVQKRHQAHILIYGLQPLIFGFILDVILRAGFGLTNLPYMTYFGWYISLLCYLAILSVRYGRTIRVNEYLNENLKKEVAKQTKEIQEANSKLESQIYRNHMDLQMASIVQQKTFEKPNNNFIGWDISISYSPLSEVSGDMYDFYNTGHILEGFSIFDVSGHGVAASLITMLAKNIVYREFRASTKSGADCSHMMTKINENVIKAKGEAENYLTGIMMVINPIQKDESCQLEFANAGHPHPILYSAEEGAAGNIKIDNYENQYGAIGIRDLDVSFQNVNFSMQPDDILVCFTDGLIEAVNSEGIQFGKENVQRIIEANCKKTASEISQAILAGLQGYIGIKPLEDDITLVVLKRQNSKDFIEEI